MTGRTISHYQILDKLGEGGMGVVYRARDTHLDRFVAIKVLPSEKVADPERKRRFVQEAKAASALNHPNIITIYDIDQADGIDYIAMEYAAGKRLDRLIPRHGMPLSEALKCGVQIADALAAAHGAGIVHRDLKPGNVMVTDKSQVKVLDFGLAKLTETGESGEDFETRTIRDEEGPRTGEGRILGTAAYMSPEQAQGKKVNARSDIFSFGSLLYEMVTGRRAFQGDSVVSTLAAIIKENPTPPSQVVEGLPKEVERLISRCLRKDPERRFQHMVDVKMALEELKEESDSGTLEPEGHAKAKLRRKLLWAAAAVGVAVLAMAGVWFLRSRTPTSEAPLAAVPLTSYPGTEGSPSFSPDGTEVAFQWCPEDPGKSCDIYVMQIGVEQPSRLTDTPAIEFSPAWSPDGRTIAFIRQLSGAATRFALVLIPQRGGRERVLGEVDTSGPGDFVDGPHLAWTPDSRWLVCPRPDAGKGRCSLYLYSVETGEKRKLTNPPAGVVGDTAPAFSPDGRILAFARQLEGYFRSDSYLLHLAGGYRPQGEPERVRLDDPYRYGAAWTPDGNEIVFGTGKGLWRMAASKTATPRRLPFGPDNAVAPAISRQGNRLAYSVERSDTNIWRIDLREPGGKPGAPVRFIASTLSDWCPAYSPDGQRIAFVSNRSGTSAIWACDADGSNAM
ncbi:MAG TPA: protein kinase, partial [Bryobacteraceae bacterium]|nr:protein kinase [Bryobacteraceae bacterium]